MARCVRADRVMRRADSTRRLHIGERALAGEVREFHDAT